MAEKPHPWKAAPQTGDKYIVRFPDGMRDRIAEAAKANNRSMNAEIVDRLETSFGGPREPYATKSQLERVFKEIAVQNNQALLSVSLVRDMLGAYVTQLFSRLSPEQKVNPELILMEKMARSAINMDEEGLTKAMTDMMRGKPGIPDDPERFFKHLASMNTEASRRRREMLDQPEASPHPVGEMPLLGDGPESPES